jgi:hypothetical protein
MVEGREETVIAAVLVNDGMGWIAAVLGWLPPLSHGQACRGLQWVAHAGDPRF